MFSLVENLKIVNAFKPQTLGSAVTGDAVCLKNAHKVWCVIDFAYGTDSDLTITFYEATDVAAGTNSAISATCPLWQNTDTATTDTLTRGTDAASITIDTGAGKNQQAVFEFDPAKFSSGYDCFYVYLASNSASNLASATYYLQERYAEDVPPTAITD